MPGSLLKANARKIILDNAPKIFIVTLLYVLILTLLSALSVNLPGTLDLQGFYSSLASGELLLESTAELYDNLRPAGVTLSLIISIISPIFDVGYMGYCMKVKRGQDSGYKDLLGGFSFVYKCIAIFLVTSLFIFLWGLLMFIPGIIAAYRYRLSYYILIDDPAKGVMQCINESKVMINGGKMDLFLIDLSFLGWVLLDWIVIMLIPLPIVPPVVQIWLAPYRGLTNVAFYEHRKSELTV